MKNYYYVRLNENQVGVNIVTSPKKINAEGYIEIPDYNETYLYRKWENNQWSQERYEPDTDFELLERLDVLEAENKQLRDEVISLNATITNLNQNINLLEDSILELTSLIALLQGGDI